MAGKDSYASASALKEYREEYEADFEAFKENMQLAEEDIRMLNGQSWPEKVKKEREDEGRPCLSFNKLPQFVDQTIGANRRNKPQIRVSLSDGAERNMEVRGAKKEMTDAEVMEGLIRQIQYASKASIAYDTAMEHMASHGWGHFRILTAYVGDDTFDQEIKFAAVRNPLSVIWDAGAEEYTREDALHCYISSAVPEASFKKQYPTAAILSFDKADPVWGKHWKQSKSILVCERFSRVPETKTLLRMSDGSVFYLDEKFEMVKDELAQAGVVVQRDRKVKIYTVKWCKMTGADILEENVFPSQYIPVIPMWGKELCVDGRYIYRGVIRHAHDAQRQLDYQRTAGIEGVALQPKAPIIVGKSQVKGFEALYETANKKNHAYLPYNDDINPNPPQRSVGPQVPVAAAALAQQAENDLYGVIGKYPPSLGDRTSEESGRAIIARQNQANDIDFVYPDNAARSVEHAGRILVDMIPRTYDTERLVRIRGEDDSVSEITINKRIVDQQSGQEVVLNDLTVGKYGVTVSVGPTFATQRMESAQWLMDFASAVPAAATAAPDLIARAQDTPIAEKLAERLKKTVPPQLLADDEQEEKTPEQMQQEQMAMQMQQQAMQAEQAEIEAKLAKAEADKADAAATIAMAEAKQAEAQAKMMALAAGPPPGTTEPPQTPADAGVSVSGPSMEELRDLVRDTVADAIAEFHLQTQGPPQ